MICSPCTKTGHAPGACRHPGTCPCAHRSVAAIEETRRGDDV